MQTASAAAALTDVAGALRATRGLRDAVDPSRVGAAGVLTATPALGSVQTNLHQGSVLKAFRALDGPARNVRHLSVLAGRNPILDAFESPMLKLLKPNGYFRMDFTERLGFPTEPYPLRDVTAFSSQRALTSSLKRRGLLDGPSHLLRELATASQGLGSQRTGAIAALNAFQSRVQMPAGQVQAMRTMLDGFAGSAGLLGVSKAMHGPAGLDGRPLMQLAAGLSARPHPVFTSAAMDAIRDSLRWSEALSDRVAANPLTVLDRVAEELLRLPDEAVNPEATDGGRLAENGLLASAISAGQELTVAAGDGLASVAQWTWGVPLWWAPALVHVWPNLTERDRQDVRNKALTASAALMSVAYLATAGKVVECLIAVTVAFGAIGEFYSLVEKLDTRP